MSDLVGNHIVGFPTRWLILLALVVLSCVGCPWIHSAVGKLAHAIYREFFQLKKVKISLEKF